ncbi:methylamine utilization protein [Rhodopirellula sp. JC740]|uniref:Methylamine utilization protein n=1 Tax=Rhodopirellula halodulae TaxID=2894198 RepID=A0ABS8NJV1_9BACT|nr:methylamine utilization protein [Rhodopirellula sp. JC740]MCC9643659.1 methylamine utilization protein [Rhodopirellula sp. JC740]
MKTPVLSIICLVTWCVASAQAADLRMQFLFDGPVPPPEPLKVDKDKAACGQLNLLDERLLVDQETKGIRNVVVYLYTGRGGTRLPACKPSKRVRKLMAKECRFEPRVVLAQSGDTLILDESEAVVGHSINLNFFENRTSGLTIPVGDNRDIALQKAEPAPIPVECNIHPWMRGWLVVLDHPYAAVSDAQGRIEIKGLPENQELTFRVFHEDARQLTNITIDGNVHQWDRNRFQVNLAEGTNDLGQVKLSPENFRSVQTAGSTGQ